MDQILIYVYIYIHTKNVAYSLSLSLKIYTMFNAQTCVRKYVRDFNIETKRSIIRLNQLGGWGGMTSLVHEFGHGMR